MTVLPRPVIEVEGVTQGVVLEFRLVVVALAVKAADEGFPPGSRDDFRPISKPLEGFEGEGPPVVIVVGGAHLLPERRRRGGEGGGGGEAAAAVAGVGKGVD